MKKRADERPHHQNHQGKNGDQKPEPPGRYGQRLEVVVELKKDGDIAEGDKGNGAEGHKRPGEEGLVRGFPIL